MLRAAKPSLILAAALLVAVLPGCDGSNDVVEPSSGEVQTNVQGGSPAAVDALGETDLAGAALTGMMGLITTAAPGAQAGVAAVVSPSCPATFELPNGITGTCTPLEQGGVSFVFGGTVSGPYGPVVVDGTFIAAPTADQPTTGSRWSADFDATAVGPRGTATWSATGTFTLDANDDVVDFAIDFTHTRTPQGGSPVVVHVTISPTRYTLVVVGGAGHTLRFEVNRETMTGTIRIDGFLVANVDFVDGCAVVDYVNPVLLDVTICPAS